MDIVLNEKAWFNANRTTRLKSGADRRALNFPS
jgi:hypothetical protein